MEIYSIHSKKAPRIEYKNLSYSDMENDTMRVQILS